MSIHVPELVKFTPNQCTELSQPTFSAQKQTDGTYTVQTQTTQDGKVISCTQQHGYTTAALAKTAINLLTASYIDTL